MRIGVAGRPDDWLVAAERGYDYFEENLAPIAAMTDEEFRAVRELPRRTGLKSEAFNCFFDGGVKLYAEPDSWFRDYCERALERAAILGGEIAVIGSAGARSVPNGMSRDDAEKRFIDILRIAGDAAESVGMRVAIEPLNHCECNFVNTVSEGAELCRRTDHKSVGTIVDFYHYFVENETPDDLVKAKDRLWHAHFARLNPDRCSPREGDEAMVQECADALKNAGYSGGRISLECFVRKSVRDDIDEAFSLMDAFRRV